MSKALKRGYDINDKKLFYDKELEKLKKAKEEIEWLLNRDYKIDPLVNFVSNKYQFTNRQRDAIKRSVSSYEKNTIRKSKRLPINKMNEGTIHIDGFNLIITLEVALSKGTLIRGSDDNIRDLAGLRGTYKIIDKTEEAINLIGIFLEKYSCSSVKFYLDSPVSNSRNLKYKILELSENWKMNIEVELVNNADIILENLDRVVSSDAAIIDKCISYFNITKVIIDEYIKDASVIDFN